MVKRMTMRMVNLMEMQEEREMSQLWKMVHLEMSQPLASTRNTCTAWKKKKDHIGEDNKISVCLG